jgi:hypothetical protein
MTLFKCCPEDVYYHLFCCPLNGRYRICLTNLSTLGLLVLQESIDILIASSYPTTLNISSHEHADLLPVSSGHRNIRC